MKLKEIKLQNFRGYKEERTVSFDDLTVIIGRNDAGKSSLLDALDIFFNGATIEQGDACVGADPKAVRITCVFSDLPASLVIDEQHPTSLENEYLLRDDGLFEVCCVYNCSTAKGKRLAIFAKARHPSNEGLNDLLTLKIKALKDRAKDRNIDLDKVNSTIKTELRQALWASEENLTFTETQIDLSAETGKAIWDKLQSYVPVFALFKSDRTSTDQDPEAQDPMKAAVKEVVKQHEQELGSVLKQVGEELQHVADKTVEKIKDMNPALAKAMNPQIKNKPWDSLFSISLAGEDGIPINKRGSGTRRLVLLNFFRAKAEDAAIQAGTGAIYAVEEPETSQHPNQQIMLLEAFQELTAQGNTQVILTTHTPTLARRVDRNLLRYVSSETGHPEISSGSDDGTTDAIRKTLGVLPDHDVKLFVGVEGKWDMEFLRRISKMLHASDKTMPNIEAHENDGNLVFIPLGGSSLELWVSRLEGLGRPEIYITDRDEQPPKNPKYQIYLTEWNSRENCEGICTQKCELENYIHPDAIKAMLPTFPVAIGDFDDVPEMYAKSCLDAANGAGSWDSLDDENEKDAEKKRKKKSNAKKQLNTVCVDNMTVDLLAASDPDSEIRGWLQKIAKHLSE